MLLSHRVSEATAAGDTHGAGISFFRPPQHASKVPCLPPRHAVHTSRAACAAAAHRQLTAQHVHHNHAIALSLHTTRCSWHTRGLHYTRLPVIVTTHSTFLLANADTHLWSLLHTVSSFWKTHSYVIATTHNTFLLANTDTHLRSLLHTVGYLLFWKHIHMPLPLHTTRSVWQTDWHSPVSDCYYTLYLLLGKKYSHVIVTTHNTFLVANTDTHL